MQQYVGMRLGRYQIVEQIGQGGMATVCKAYQPSMDRYVAIKILPSHFTEDESFVGRFTQEARTLARLEHPHILPVYDYGEQEGITYLVMRYVEAGTLKDLIHREGPLDVKEAARIVGQVADALECGHRQGVVHRDIKPSNVLIDQYGNTFLTDFGIAKLVAETEHFTASGAVIGTPAYMSPEQGMGQPVDARCDIYSLGIVLYELVTGRVPFRAETPLAVLLKHLNAPLPPPRQVKPDLPAAVERVILKALAKSPDDRYQTARELAAALDRAVVDATEERPVPQPPEGELDETVLRPVVSPPPPAVAPEALAEQRRLAELDDLYGQAVGAMDAGQWAQARALLAQIQEREPGYREVERLLDQAEAELEQAKADRQRREQIASLYEEAQSLARTRQWQPALAKMDEIQALDAEFADPEGIGARAREQVAEEEAEAQRQNELAALYAEAVRLLKADQYEEALQKWDEVQAIDPHYRDRKKVQATARKKLARLAKPARKRRLPRWGWIAAGTVAVAAIVVAGVLILRTLSTAPPTPRSMPTDLKAGAVWEWSDGSAMVYVPAGAFWMGSEEDSPEANPNEMPPHPVSLDAFWIDRTEVTNAQYERCVKDEGCDPPAERATHVYGDYYGESQYDDYPVVQVDWGQARAYCAWAGKRLPSEAEWEKAARGTDRRIYPWGNEFDGNLANFCDGLCTFDHRDRAWNDGYVSIAPVGSYEGGASPYGALDMAGNVHEWTSSLDWPYPYNARDGREDPDGAGPRVVRGGSFGAGWPGVRTASKEARPPAEIGVDVGFRCIQPAAEPLALQGGRIAFVSGRDGNQEIYVMNADGSEQINLTKHPADDWMPSWSPDGQRIAFVSERDGNPEIYVMTADGSGQTRLTDSPYPELRPAWSPDGRRIAFLQNEAGNDDIWVMDTDGSHRTRLTDAPAHEVDPSWSPDGQRIAFASDAYDNQDIFVMNAEDGSGNVRLTTHPAGDFLPCWSPDGTRIAFGTGRDENEEIYVMNADGSEQANLTNHPASDWFASWSPNGEQLAFASDRDGNREIYVMAADGSGPVRLTFNDAEDWQVAWSPTQ
jgi:formylglycine-generating enzyme required for sulfatase activity